MSSSDYINSVTCLKKVELSVINIIKLISFEPRLFTQKEFITFRRGLGEQGQAFIKSINLAVLGGEFYSEEAKTIIDDLLNKQIPLLAKKIDEFTAEKIIPNHELQRFITDRSKSLNDEFLEKFIREYIKGYHKIGDYIRKYSELLGFVRTSVLQKDKISIKSFLAESIDKMETYKLISELELEVASSKTSESFHYIVKNRFAIFQLNVLLFKVDNTLVSSSTVIERLTEIRQLLQREIFTGFDLTRILIDKSNYLLKKTVLRQLENQNFIDDYSADHTPVSELEITCYKIFDEKTSCHYYEGIGSTPTQTEVDYEKKVSSNDAQFEHFHYLNRRYRKGDRKDKVEFFKKQFEKYKKRKFLSPANRFEEIAFHTTANLINNTEFMLLCRKSLNQIKAEDKVNKIDTTIAKEIDKIHTLYKACMDGQMKMDRFNHRAPLEFFRYITEVIETISEKAIAFNTLNRIMELALLCRTHMKEYFKWEKNKNDLPLYFPFDESICFYDLDQQKPIKDKKTEFLVEEKYIKLFLDSNYVLPVNYLNIESDVLELELKYEHHKNMLIDLTVEGNLEKSKEELQSEVKQSTKQYISLLAMFATILSFVLGTVKIALEFKTVEKIIVFMVGFASSLMIFSMMIEFTIVRSSKERTTYHYFLLFLSIALVAFCMWLLVPNTI